MKKLISHIIIILLFFVVFTSCEEQNDSPQLKKESFEFREGRLVFEDKSALQKTITNLNQYSLEELDDWERKINGFNSLRSSLNENDTNPELSLPISSVINKDGIFQVGDTIIYLAERTEYFIMNENIEMVERLRKDISNNIEAEYEGIIKKPVELKVIPLGSTEKESSNNALNWKDARYQYQFSNWAGQRKFVFEVHVYDYFYWIQLEVRSKFEYKGSNGWKAAGETVEKKINNLYISGIASYPEGPFNLFYPNMYQSDGNNLVVFHAFAADYISDLEIGGYFYAKVMNPNFDYKTYTVPNAYWYKSFLSK